MEYQMPKFMRYDIFGQGEILISIFPNIFVDI